MNAVLERTEARHFESTTKALVELKLYNVVYEVSTKYDGMALLKQMQKHGLIIIDNEKIKTC